MKKNIFTKDWMAMHPFEKPDSVDLYYTNLANSIYHILDEACFVHNFKMVEQAKRLALSVAGYFEDVISGTCIWKTFTAECKKRYGVYVPFYLGAGEAYEPDEINLADVKFLLWHHYQQSVFDKEAVPPLFGTLEVAARLVYDLLDKEFETAPENTRLYDFLATQPIDDKHFFQYREVLVWFHFACWFNVSTQPIFFALLDDFARRNGGLNDAIVYALQMEQAVLCRATLLSLPSHEWLARVSAFHPAHKHWTDVESRTARYLRVNSEDEEYVYVTDLYEDEELKLAKDSVQIDDYTPFLKGELVIFTNIFKYGGAWWVNGLMEGRPYDDEIKKAIAEGKDHLHFKEGLADYAKLKAKGYGDKFVFLKDCKALREFCESLGFEEEKLARLPKEAAQGIMVSGSPYNGLNLTVGIAHCIYSDANPYYNKERASQDALNLITGNVPGIPYELVNRLVEHGMLPDVNVFTSKYVGETGLRMTQDNLQFLADYHLMACKEKDVAPEELW